MLLAVPGNSLFYIEKIISKFSEFMAPFGEDFLVPSLQWDQEQ